MVYYQTLHLVGLMWFIAKLIYLINVTIPIRIDIFTEFRINSPEKSFGKLPIDYLSLRRCAVLIRLGIFDRFYKLQI